MSEVNWDENARAAVKAYHWWLGSDDNCGLELDESLDKFIKEVVARKATKTVEDAVEAFPDGWENPEYDCIAYNPSSNTFEYYVHTFEINRNWYHVCTREQFEACAAKKGEKWTHTYSDYGVRKGCIVMHDKPDIHGQVLVMNRYGEYVLTDTAKLKPIKPKITKSQAWDKCQDYDGCKSMKAFMYDLHEEYDLI